jgi:hypothetical protein
MLESVIQEVASQQMEDGHIWIEALPARTYHTDAYGDVPITLSKLEEMVQNFKDGIRGQEIATDFEHGLDRAKGYKASGWYRDFDIRPSSADARVPSLYARIELTEEAKAEIKDNQWKYFSLDWDDAYSDSEMKDDSIPNVIVGGGFTNRPVAKHTMPINFSETMWEELDEDTRKQFAVWSTAFVNNLPDSAFLYIQSGGSKDSEGKTVPRSLRHFPYKGPDGKVDLPHLRNAIARIPQAGGWLSDASKSALQSRARKMLGAGSTAMAEGGATLEIFENMLELYDESKEWEHSEPGTGPIPRLDEESGIDDPANTGGWRRQTPPVVEEIEEGFPQPPLDSKGGDNQLYELTDTQAVELLRVLDLPTESDGDKIVEATKLMFGELAEVKRTADAATQEKEFAEKYPQFWQEHNALMIENREHNAKTFSESIKDVRKAEGRGLRNTRQQLSGLALEKVEKLHMKFAEGDATVEEFEDCIKTIANGGIVQMGEIGSSASGEDKEPIVDLNDVQASRIAFNEQIMRVQAEEPELDFRAAYAKAAALHPDLAEAANVSAAA